MNYQIFREPTYSGQVETDALKKNLQIIIENPKILLKLLRNFGHLITNLEIRYWNPNPMVYVGIETYLAKYCSDSVQRLSLKCSYRQKNPFQNVYKPLKKVIALTIILPAYETLNQIRFINGNNLPNVQRIYISNRNPKLSNSDRIHFENIEYFTMHTIRIYSYPFSFGNLKHFTIYGNVVVNNALCECIGEIEHLKTLKIMSFALFSIESISKMLELQNVVANVEEIQFKFHDSVSLELILRFLKQSKRLQKLSIHQDMKYSNANTIYKYSNLLQTIPSNLHDDEWKCCIKDPYKNSFSSFPTYKCLVVERTSL